MSENFGAVKYNIRNINSKNLPISGVESKSCQTNLNNPSRILTNNIKYNLNSKTLKSTVDKTTIDEKTIQDKSKINILIYIESFSVNMLETSVSSKSPSGFKKIDKLSMKLSENKISADYFSTENQMTIKESDVENELQFDEKMKKNYFNEKNKIDDEFSRNLRNKQKLEKEIRNNKILNYDNEKSRKFDGPIRLNLNSKSKYKGGRNVNSKILKNVVNKTQEIKLTNTQPIFQTKHIKESMNKLKTGSYQSPALRNFKLDYYINKQIAQEKKEEEFLSKMKAKTNLLSEEINEKKDEAHFGELSVENQKYFIRKFLRSKDNKLNQNNEILDGVFDKFETRVNFLSDIFIVPHIKNKIFANSESNKKELHEKMEYLKLNDSIEKPVQLYINSLKRKFQQEKDQMEEMCKQDKLKGIDNNFSNAFIKFYQKSNEEIKNLLNAEHSDYLNFKYDRYNNVDFASGRENLAIKEQIKKEQIVGKKKKMFEGLLGGIIKKMSIIPTVNYSQ